MLWVENSLYPNLWDGLFILIEGFLPLVVYHQFSQVVKSVQKINTQIQYTQSQKRSKI